MTQEMVEYLDKLSNLHIPRYHEIPDIDLYMDQLIAYLNSQLELLRVDPKESVITTSMVNNYVKSGVILPTKKKRYSKNHVAYLMVVCVFKQIFPIVKISKMIEIQTKTFDIEVAYDYFCVELENALISAFSSSNDLAKDTSESGSEDRIFVRASVTAFACKLLVEKTLEFRLTSEDKNK